MRWILANSEHIPRQCPEIYFIQNNAYHCPAHQPSMFAAIRVDKLPRTNLNESLGEQFMGPARV